MKTRLFFTAVASLALFSCSNDEFVGETPTPVTTAAVQRAINFGVGNNTAFTRAENPNATVKAGTDAAKLLKYQFQVYGAKNTGSAYTKVFDNYSVWYVDGSSNDTDSNTDGWDYVGEASTAYGTTGNTVTLTSKQTIKYWDYSCDDYMFWAVSPVGKATFTVTDGKVTGFTLADVASKDDPIMIAYPKQVKKAAYNGQTGVTDPAVEMRFISLQSKVRIAMYDAVPGYKISDLKFYTDNNTAKDNNVYLYRQDGKNFSTNADYEITFDNTNIDAKGNGGISTTIGTPTTQTTETSYMSFGTVTGDLSTSAATPTAGDYVNVLPDNTLKELYLKADFTLTSDDGSGETINVKGATAVIPEAYTKWDFNTAYTYVFKITKNINGTTGTPGVDPEGLFPITFDAVVEDVVDETNREGTISTLGTYSITTYQKGSVDGNNLKYVTGKDIDVTVMYVDKTAGTYTDVTNKDALATGGAAATITVVGPKGSTYESATVITKAKKFQPNVVGEYTITYTSATSSATETPVKVTKVVNVQ